MQDLTSLQTWRKENRKQSLEHERQEQRRTRRRRRTRQEAKSRRGRQRRHRRRCSASPQLSPHQHAVIIVINTQYWTLITRWRRAHVHTCNLPYVDVCEVLTSYGITGLIKRRAEMFGAVGGGTVLYQTSMRQRRPSWTTTTVTEFGKRAAEGQNSF